VEQGRRKISRTLPRAIFCAKAARITPHYSAQATQRGSSGTATAGHCAGQEQTGVCLPAPPGVPAVLRIRMLAAAANRWPCRNRAEAAVQLRDALCCGASCSCRCFTAPLPAAR
jgi:hypothetical protein